MKSLASIHARRSFKPQPEFMLSTIDLMFNEIHSIYFTDELTKRENRVRVRDYYNNNRETLLEKVNCVCGGSYNKLSKLRHERTKKHQRYINDQ